MTEEHIDLEHPHAQVIHITRHDMGSEALLRADHNLTQYTVNRNVAGGGLYAVMCLVVSSEGVFISGELGDDYPQETINYDLFKEDAHEQA